jgi:hypothetical protein
MKRWTIGGAGLLAGAIAGIAWWLLNKVLNVAEEEIMAHGLDKQYNLPVRERKY